MPVVIDEVIISIKVDNKKSGRGRASAAKVNAQEKKQIIEECVEQVMEILARKDEP